MKAKTGMAFFPDKYNLSINCRSITAADYKRGARMITPHFEYWEEAHKWLHDALHERWQACADKLHEAAKDVLKMYEMKPPLAEVSYVLADAMLNERDKNRDE